MNQAERRRNRVRASRPAAAEPLERRQLFTTIGGGAAIAFAAHVDTAVGTAPVALAVADFNRDGDLDVVAVDQTGEKADVLFGNGAGGFSAGPTMALPGPPSAVVVGDFNGDGYEDVAVACSPGNVATAGTSVTVFLGGPGGTFGLGQTTQVEPAGGGSTEPVALVAGDFNGDGHLDLAATEYASSKVAVLLGTGTGTFAAPQTFGVGIDPTAIATADFNGDGHLDLAVVSNVTATTGVAGDAVSVFNGDGAGTFNHAYDVALADSGAQTIAAADLNGDGKPDVVVGEAGATATVVLNVAGTLTVSATIPTQAGSTGLAIADFNVDGAPDVVTANGGTVLSNVADDTVTVAAGLGTGFAPSTSAGATTLTSVPSTSVATGADPVGLAVGDFNNDGKPDVVTADEGSGSISVLLNDTVVTQEPTKTALAADPVASASAGGTVTLTATVTPTTASPLYGESSPTGTVGFYDGSTLLGDEAVAAGTTAGTAVATFATAALPIGTVKLTAVYRGDVGYNASTSAMTSYVIAPTATEGPDLVASFVASGLPGTLAPGSTATVKVQVTNQGNTVAAGLLGSSLYLSLDATLDAGDTLVSLKGSLARTTVKLLPNKSVVLTGTFTVPAGQPVGTYVPIVVLNTLAGGLLESSTANNTTVSPTTTAVADAFGSVGGRANVPLTIADADGTTAVLHLTGPGTGSAALTDEGLDLTLTGTTARTAVSITNVAKGGTFTLDDVSAAAAVGSLRLMPATVTGTVTLGGGATTVVLGAVAGGSLTAAAGIRSLSATAWTAGTPGGTAVLVVPWVGTLTTRGDFDPAVSLSGVGAPAGVAANSVTVGGALASTLFVATGAVNRITAGSVPVGFVGSITGGLRQLAVGGSFDGTLAAGSIAAVTVRGNLTDARILAGADLNMSIVGGGTDYTLIDDGNPTYAAGTIGSVRVGGSETASVVAAGATGSSLLPALTPPTGYAALPGGSIKSIVVTGTVDSDSRFVAAALPVRATVDRAVVSPAADPRFTA